MARTTTPGIPGRGTGSSPDEERRFVQTISDWILALPHDLRVLFEAKDDPNLDRDLREMAGGAILLVLTPDTSGDESFVGFARSALVLRSVLSRMAQRGGEGVDAFRERFAEHFERIDDGLGMCAQVMGDDLYVWACSKLEALLRAPYKGKKVPAYLDDDESMELLYEDGLAFGTDFPLDEDKLRMRLKRAETLLEPMRRRANEDRKKLAG